MDAVNTESSDEPTIELDQVFGLLKNRRRRDVLRHLSENDETVRVGELAEKVAARECEKPVSQVNSQERKRVYVGLYQCHLPKLADLGVIDYNKPRGVIDPGPAFEEVAQYLPDEGTSAEQEGSDRPLLEFLSKTVATGRNLL